MRMNALLLVTLCLLPALASAQVRAADAPGALRNRIEALSAAAGAEVGVAFEALDGSRRLALGDTTEFHAASTMKVPVMIELYRQAGAGTLSLDTRIPVVNEFHSSVDGSPYALSVGDDSDGDIYKAIGRDLSYRELCEAMITVSSNLATNVLIERLGVERIRQTVADYGASGMNVRRGVEDNKAYQAGVSNTTTARGLATLLLAIGREQAVSVAASDEMQAILKRQTFNDAIPAGLPPGTVVAHKTGNITKIHHDAAIVLGARPYVLVVLTRGVEDQKKSAALIADIAREIHAWAVQ
jgi:beta-lactamase class A